MNKLLVSVTASLALLAATPTMAQQEGQQTPANPQTQNPGYSDPAAAGTQSTNFSDAQLKEFIKAQDRVMEVREEYIEKIEAADSQQEAQELQMKANDKMVSAIQDAGIEISTYNAIATAYGSEPKIRNRVDALM